MSSEWENDCVENAPYDGDDISPRSSFVERVRRASSQKYQNEVTLRGRIAKIVEAKSVTIVTVAVQATLTLSNYPSVMFFGDTREQVKAFKENDRVYIKATLQSYDKRKLRKGQSTELIIGVSMIAEADAPAPESVEPEESRPIENFNTDENRIEIKGQILGIECDERNTPYLTIRTFTNQRMSIIKYPYYARNVDNFLRNVYVHQFVRAVGTVQTAMVPEESLDDSRAVKARIIETATSIRAPEPEKRLKTRKQQLYILYDVYAD